MVDSTLARSAYTFPFTFALARNQSQVWGENGDLFRSPVLAEAGDELTLEDEDGHLSYSLADFLDQVVELRFPFNDGRIVIEIEIQQLTLDIALRFRQPWPSSTPESHADLESVLRIPVHDTWLYP
jgi:hypothetical protein